jgi:hypothetical protein
MTERIKRLSRRRFLFVAGSGGALAAVAMAARTEPPIPSLLQRTDKRATRGYQASEHVNRYYRTAKI